MGDGGEGERGGRGGYKWFKLTFVGGDKATPCAEPTHGIEFLVVVESS